MNINVNAENIDFFQCFSSTTKLKIIEYVAHEPRNIGELATLLGVSSTIVTRHVNALESSGIIKSDLTPGKRGLQKVCSLATDEVTLSFRPDYTAQTTTSSISIPIGQFVSYDVSPTCGLASPGQLIGLVDDPRYFSNPEKVTASLLWFQKGFVEYTIPSYIFTRNVSMDALTISLELCSEYPGYKDDFLSDVYFTLGGQNLGYWTSPGNYGSKKGLYTPAWWTMGSEYGLLKTILINNTGTYLDGNLMSSITLKDLNINHNDNMTLKISSPSTAAHPGGVTLFGKGFGNYNQDILVTAHYSN